MTKSKPHPLACCLLLFIVCAVARLFEYFILKTDETILSENFVHKILGIALLFFVLKRYQWNWSDIGFARTGMLRGIGKGILLGSLCFAVAYSVESLVLYCLNRDVHFAFYATGFSLTNDSQRQTGLVFLVLCILFNVINVWMEEGVFRGLFTRLLEGTSFLRRILLIALLFGVWHWAMPLRDYIRGNSSLTSLLIMGIGYLILAGIMSVKWSLLYRLSGSLWIGLGDHLFNNVIATNLLHVISNGEADSLQIVRIMIGQLLSFAVVLAYYRKHCQEITRAAAGR